MEKALILAEFGSMVEKEDLGAGGGGEGIGIGWGFVCRWWCGCALSEMVPLVRGWGRLRRRCGAGILFRHWVGWKGWMHRALVYLKNCRTTDAQLSFRLVLVHLAYPVFTNNNEMSHQH